MNPEDRLDTRVASCNTMPVELKEEILAALSFYRQALYNARHENSILKKNENVRSI